MYLKKYLMTIAAALCMLPLSAINPQNSKMKELNVKKVSVANIPVESVPALLDEEKVAFQPVNTVNWLLFLMLQCGVPHSAYGRCHSAAFQGKGSECTRSGRTR